MRLQQPKIANYKEQPLQFERLLTELSLSFINLPVDMIDNKIAATLKSICDCVGFDSRVLAQWNEATELFVITHSAGADGDISDRTFKPGDIPCIADKIFRGERCEVVRFRQQSKQSDQTVRDVELLCQTEIQFAVICPLKAEERILGFLCFGTSRGKYECSEYCLDRLSIIADVFANTLARNDVDGSVFFRSEERRSWESERKLSEQALIDMNVQLLDANEKIRKMKEQLECENIYLKEEIKLEKNHAEIIGRSQAILQVLAGAEKVAATDSAVLLLGETGTGKELIARAIHKDSKRKHRLMVTVNCAALPASLVENELFGRERGAYTGALTREVGRFELADQSTIFLDEIGELPLELQSKLLRVLQEGEFERLGCSKTIHVDVRLIAATSRDLEAAVKEGKFREDLYYRLNVFPICVPPLRARKEDIPMLTWHFLHKLGERMGRDVESVKAATMGAFQTYSWPGNVRELRNVIERNLIIHPGAVFEAELPERTGEIIEAGTTIEEVEKNHICLILRRSGWRIRGRGGAAEILGLKPTTLEARMKKLGIVRK
jgi:transcriptional regulator with GAF, ATPase, and Fis domain